MSYFDDVVRFHLKFGLPVMDEQRRCRPMAPADAEYRLKFLEEELAEFKEALVTGRLDEQLDALADLVWVALGTAAYMGAPFDAAWAEVRRANMEKVRGQTGDGGHRRGAREPIRKPPGWRPPDMELVISRHNDAAKPPEGADSEGGAHD